jgi:hypothetical protein
MNADELDGLRTLLSVAPGSVDLEESAKMLLAYIDSQDRQLATLKAALIRERAIQSMMRCECKYGYENVSPSVKCIENAKSELVHKLPMIDWEDMK